MDMADHAAPDFEVRLRAGALQFECFGAEAGLAASGAVP
jgi:hypothetical protein